MKGYGMKQQEKKMMIGLKRGTVHLVPHQKEWSNYINFRDYLNAFPEKAMLYDLCKQKLAMQFSNDRKSYTMGKEEIIQRLLTEARMWKLSSLSH